MAESRPQPPTAPRAVVLFLLVIQIVGTLAMCGYAFWQFLAHENRGDGLLYLSLGLMWYLLLGWRVRWLTHPGPS